MQNLACLSIFIIMYEVEEGHISFSFLSLSTIERITLEFYVSISIGDNVANCTLVMLVYCCRAAILWFQNVLMGAIFARPESYMQFCSKLRNYSVLSFNFFVFPFLITCSSHIPLIIFITTDWMQCLEYWQASAFFTFTISVTIIDKILTLFSAFSYKTTRSIISN